METKKCKYCMTSIPKAARVCPQCGRKQGGKLKWIIIVLIVLVIGVGAAGGGGDSDSSSKASTAKNTSDSGKSSKKSKQKDGQEEEKIEYTEVTVKTLIDDLEANALVAADKYKGNYYAVTGRLSNIDAQGDYISLEDPSDDWGLTDVTCYIKSDEVLDKVKTLAKDSKITVRGKMTDVGEVLGYSLDIDSID